MGVVDGCWCLAQRALFAATKLNLSSPKPCRVITLSLPNCGKAKWIDAKSQPVKFCAPQSARSL